MNTPLTQRFKQTVHELYPRILGHARQKLVSLHQVNPEDLVQETLFKAWKNLDKLVDLPTIEAWIWQILKRDIITAYRRGSRRLAPVQLPEEVVDRSAEIAEEREKKFTLAERAKKFLQKLPEQERHAMELRYLQGEKLQAIADELGCSVGTVKNRVKEGRATLLRLLRSEEE